MNTSRPLWPLIAAGLALFRVAHAAPERLENFDNRPTAPPAAAEAEAAAAPAGAVAQRTPAARLRSRVRAVQFDVDPRSGGIRFVRSPSGFLTGPRGEGGGVSAAAVAPFKTGDPDRGPKGFLQEHRELFGYGAEVLSGAVREREVVDRDTGLRTVIWRQEVAGIRIFGAALRAHTTLAGELVNVDSELVADPDGAAERGGGRARAGAPTIPPARAVALAAANLGEPVEEHGLVTEATEPGRPDRSARFSHSRLNGATAALVWLPVDAVSMRLTWEVVLTSRGRGEMFRVLVDAETGQIWVRQGLTEYAADATYRVFTGDSPSPFSPGHSMPSSTQPPGVSRVLVTLGALDATASPAGWIPEGVNETRGNNVDAHTDANADNVADTPRPQGDPVRVFDFPLDLAQAPSSYRSAAVVDLFYWCNWIHDRLYQLGFTEAYGNFQNDNFGRGGLGNDAVQADAQDGSGTDNANFSSPPDGSPGRMQMYVFTGPTPDRDGDFDHEIVIHEYVHGLSNRLVGAGSGISATQTRGLGEGWSDFYPLCLLSEPGDSPTAAYPAGGYATHQLGGLTENYYYGIRRYPYSTDLSKNPLTFRDIDPVQASPHTGIPRSPIIGNSASEVHNVGEVWCAMLWEVRANLILGHGAAMGNELALQLVTDGMKLSPANPTFVQARDAILQADIVRAGGLNRGAIWSGFAKRGLGFGAVAPDNWTTTGVVESYLVPDDLAITPNGSTSPIGPVGGPFLPSSWVYTLSNTGNAAVTWSASVSDTWLGVSSGGGVLPPGGSTPVTVSLQATAGSLAEGTYSAGVTFRNEGSGTEFTRPVSLTVEPYSVSLFHEDWESGVIGPAWAVSGTGPHRTAVATANGPHAGSYHLTMDSASDASYARNELTLTLDLAGKTGLELRFWVKMFSDEPDGPPSSPFGVGGGNFDGVAVSADGISWYEIQPLRTALSAWTLHEVDLDAAVAALGLSYTPAFRIRFNHYDNYGIPTDGFAFDDIEVRQIIENRVVITAPPFGVEGGPAANGTVSVMPPAAADRLVVLGSSDPGEVAVPPTLVLPAGQVSVPFVLSFPDDALVDGEQTATVWASVSGFTPGTALVAVRDNETANLTLSLPSSVVEGQGTATGRIDLDAPAGSNVTVTLMSEQPGDLQVPASVTILAGSASANFTLTVVDDGRIDGTVPVIVRAVVSGWPEAVGTVSVADNESAVLQLVLPAGTREGAGTCAGTVSISGTLDAPLVVTLASDDAGELSPPSTVVISAGSTSAGFVAAVIDDPDPDGPQTVRVSASASGFSGSSRNITVADNDAHHFVIGPVANPQIRNDPFVLTITACDVSGAVVPEYGLAVQMAAAGAAGPVSISPATISGAAWVNGTWTGEVSIADFATAVVITLTDSGNRSASSGPFDVVAGPVAGFRWSAVPSPLTMDTPFAATVTAVDAGGNPASAYNGDLEVRAVTPGGLNVLSWVGYADTSSTGEYENTKRAILSGFGNFTETNTSATDPAQLAGLLAGKQILLIPEQELASAGVLGPLGTAWRDVLVNFVGGGGEIIVCSWQGEEHLMLVNAGLLTATKASSPSVLQLTKPGDTPLNAGVTVPFQGSYIATYTGTNGVVSLQSASDGSAVVIHRDIGAGRVVLIGTDYFTTGTGLDRVVANAASLATSAGLETRVMPSGPVTMINGVWSGNLSLPFPARGIRLRAFDGSGREGLSGMFDVLEAGGPAGSTGTVFSEPFESGILGPWWTVTGTGPFRSQVTMANSPRAGSFHLTLDASGSAGYARNEATLTLDLTGRTGVVLSFWAVGYSEDSHGPPASPFIGGADFDGVAISADGVQWWEVQPLRSLGQSYAQYTVDLDSAIAARGLAYGSSFRIRFNQYDNFPIPTDGIGIDDILVTATPRPVHSLGLPATVGEAAGPVAGTLSVPAVSGVDRVFLLSSSAPARLRVPASVTVPAGALSATFDCTPLDNDLLDGNRRVHVKSVPGDGDPAWAEILVLDDETTSLSLSVPGETAEGGAAVTAVVTLGAPSEGEIVLEISHAPTGQLTSPATLRFPPGSMSATFLLTPVDDPWTDGTQEVTVSVGAPGWSVASATVRVLDNDSQVLALSLPVSVTEGAGNATGTVTLGSVAAGNFTVDLVSDDPTEIQVPATIIVPAGQSSRTFSITVVDDNEIDGTRHVNVSASAAGWVLASAALDVLDNESSVLALNATATLTEGQSSQGTVSLPGTLPEPLAITIASSDPSQLAVANTTVTIPAGSTSAAFTFNAPDNALTDGTRNVTLTASAPGFAAALRAVSIRDNDVHHFVFTVPVASPQLVNRAFAAAVEARDVGGQVIPSFSGNVALVAQAPGYPALPVTPSALALVAGQWTGSITVGDVGAGVVLTVSGAVATGTSNAFDVQVGPVHHLAISTIPSEIAPGASVPVTITARDEAQNLVVGFTGNAALSAGPSPSLTGNGSAQYVYPFQTGTRERAQFIYPAARVGAAGNLTQIELQASVYSSTSVGNVTVRLKPTSMSAYGDSPAWEASGWTTVFQGDLGLPVGGPLWISIPFTAPFAYDGTSNLMVDISRDGSGPTAGAAHSVATNLSSNCTLWLASSNSGSPVSWNGSSPTPGTSKGLPNLRITRERNVGIVPVTTGNFAAGVWTGNFAIADPVSGITLLAQDGSGVSGESNIFSVVGVSGLSVSPTTGFNLSGNFGGPFGSGPVVYTLSNPGNVSTAWSASRNGTWFDLSSAAGTLPAGGSTQVTVTPSPGLEPGNYSGSVSFANLSGGNGSTSRGGNLTVILPAPVLLAEPPSTGGPSNTVEWAPVAGASNYLVQAGKNLTFGGAASSGIIAGPSHTFNNLTDGTAYYYRVLARRSSPGGVASWSQSSQTEFGNGTANRTTASAQPGSVVLTTGNLIIQETFDEAGTDWAATAFANVDVAGAYRSSLAGVGPATSPAVPVNQGGDLEGRMGATTLALMADVAGNRFGNGFIEGNFCASDRNSTHSMGFVLRASSANATNGYAASVRLAGNSTARVEVLRLTNGIGTALGSNTTSFSIGANDNIRLRFTASGNSLAVYLWRLYAVGNSIATVAIPFNGGGNTLFLNDSTYTTGLAGIRHSPSGAADMLVDDVLLDAAGTGTTYLSSGNYLSPAITPASLSRWGNLSYSVNATAPGTSVTIDVLSTTNVTLAANLSNGADLGAIPAVAGQTAIRLRANLATTDPANTPRLDDWSVGWQEGDTVTGSAWSAVVVSTQDRSPPALTHAGPDLVVTPTVVLNGTASDVSGIASVTVNGAPGSSADGFAHWLSGPVALVPGSNILTVTASDGAIPPNQSTANRAVFYAAPHADSDADGLPDAWEVEHGLGLFDAAGRNGTLGDPDRNGVTNLVEYALDVESPAAVGTALPRTWVEANPLDGRRYLMISFRRRTDDPLLSYTLETAAGPRDWRAAPERFETVGSPASNPGGRSETVTWRLLPALDDGGTGGFVRLRVHRNP